MSLWRPVELNAIYVISSVRGSIAPLRLICNRILPLRKSDGGQDQLVMLGNYIGEGKSSYDVLEFLVKAKQKNKDRLILLKGTQEKNLLKAIDLKEDKDYDYWLSHGGKSLAIEYIKKANIGISNPYLLPRERLKSIVPKSHVELLRPLTTGCGIVNGEQGAYMFTESIMDLLLPSNMNVFGFNEKIKEPYLDSKSLSLDAGAPKRLIVMELNSMEAFTAKPRKKRLVKYDIQEI